MEIAGEGELVMAPVSRKEPFAEIERMVKRIVDEFAPQRIILFGSYARGTYGPDSDVDLLVIMNVEGSKKEIAIQIDRTLIDRKIPLDIIVATPEDVERYRGLVGNVIRPALEEGRILYERAA
jgi:predicted nucleotidyltransferase